MASLTFVLKTVERCNINCTYCYFFNGIDSSFKKHPPYVNHETIHAFSTFVRDAVKKNHIKKVFISLHGGEPLMQKKHEFSSMCSLIRESISPYANVYFSLQTNGLLIDEEWLGLLAMEKVHIGISLDGQEEYHDKYRIDKRGKGTFKRVVDRIQLTKKHHYYGKVGVGILSVLSPGMDPLKSYSYLTGDLGVDAIDYLIPDNNYNYPSEFKKGELGDILAKLFLTWVAADSPNIVVRYFQSLLGNFFGRQSKIYGVGRTANVFPLVTVSSNGDLAPVDEFRSTNPQLMMENGNVNTTTFNEMLRKSNFKITQDAVLSLPDDCQNCCWKNICHGGPVVTRYSKQNGFNNKSYFCEDLKILYTTITTYLLENGFGSDDLIEILK